MYFLVFSPGEHECEELIINKSLLSRPPPAVIVPPAEPPKMTSDSTAEAAVFGPKAPAVPKSINDRLGVVPPAPSDTTSTQSRKQQPLRLDTTYRLDRLVTQFHECESDLSRAIWTFSVIQLLTDVIQPSLSPTATPNTAMDKTIGQTHPPVRCAGAPTKEAPRVTTSSAHTRGVNASSAPDGTATSDSNDKLSLPNADDCGLPNNAPVLRLAPCASIRHATEPNSHYRASLTLSCVNNDCAPYIKIISDEEVERLRLADLPDGIQWVTLRLATSPATSWCIYARWSVE